MWNKTLIEKDDVIESVRKTLLNRNRNKSGHGLLSPKFITNALMAVAGLFIIYGLHLTAGASDFKNTVTLQNKTFAAKLADTPAERELGLSGSNALGEKQAMLFVYDEPERACFWMKDMRFNIDILWFDENKKLIYYRRNVSPNTYPKSYCSPRPAKYVMEIKPGSVPVRMGQTFVLQKQ